MAHLEGGGRQHLPALALAPGPSAQQRQAHLAAVVKVWIKPHRPAACTTTPALLSPHSAADLLCHYYQYHRLFLPNTRCIGRQAAGTFTPMLVQFGDTSPHDAGDIRLHAREGSQGGGCRCGMWGYSDWQGVEGTEHDAPVVQRLTLGGIVG